MQNIECTHIQDLTITVPVNQLSYQTGTDSPRQFFPDELGYISTVPPPKFPREMNVDFRKFNPTRRDLDMSYNHLEDHFQGLNFASVPPRELNGQDTRDPTSLFKDGVINYPRSKWNQYL
jgi:hypothetical protein